jgi:Secretion system C-terminal sorting domain
VELKMKNKLLLSLLISLMVVSYSNAQYSKIIRGAKPNVNLFDVQAKAKALIQAAGAADTIAIPAGADGIVEATINADTLTSGGSGRINPNRVYKLAKNTLYNMLANINIINPTGVLTIVGEKGGTKPVLIPIATNGVDPAPNNVQGSIKLDNLHWQCMVNDGNWLNSNLFNGSTSNKLPQFVNVNNCFFEFMFLDTFSCDGYSAGAKFKFTNCYFRNYFYPGQWWGARVFYCKQAIDTVWVENCTTQGAGLTFLQQSSLCAFAYYNHNTIVNNNKYWQLGVYYLEGYWVNNLFINQNWVGEDFHNVATGGQDPDNGMLMGNFGLDTLTQQSGKTKYPIHMQARYLNADSSVNASLCGLDKIKALVADNVLWTDTVLLAPYYKNIGGKYGVDNVNNITGAPLSYLTWNPGTPPYPVVNVPGIWMNPRTTALFSGKYKTIVQKDNYINQQVTTVTPGIKDATVADQMALWDAAQWGVPGLAAADLQHSAYINGDFDPTTIPGIKTEDGSGITKFTDLNESYAQTGTKFISKIDGLEIGSQIWNDAANAAYQAADAKARLAKVIATLTDVKQISNQVPENYSLSQNYPNPFNPTTTINFAIPKTENVKLVVYNMLGQEVKVLVDQVVNGGTMKVTWDGKNSHGSAVSSGVYFYRLSAGSFTATHKMILMK